MFSEQKSSEEIQKTIESIQQVLKVNENKIETFNLIQFGSENENWKYTNYLFYIILQMIQNVNFDSDAKEELISVKNLNSFFKVIQEASNFSCKVCLNKNKDSTRIPEAITYNTTNLSESQYAKLVNSIGVFERIFDVKLICASGLLDDCKLDYIIGLVTVITANKNKCDVENCTELLEESYKKFSHELIFKFLLLLKGFLGLSKEFHLFTNKELLKLIKLPTGFQILCKTLLNQSNTQNPVWKLNETIANIAMGVMKDKNFGFKMIDNIFSTLRVGILNSDVNLVGASVASLKKVYEKPPKLFKEKIENVIQEKLNVLVNPDVVLQGAILMEHEEIRFFIDYLYSMFSGSTMAALPSKIIVPYLSVLFKLYLLLPENGFQKEKLAAVIVFCVGNRSQVEISEIMKKVLLKEQIFEKGDDSEQPVAKFHDFHEKVVLKSNNALCSLQIGNPEIRYQDESSEFLSILQNSNNNLLVYNVFLCALQLFEETYLFNQQDENSTLIEGTIDKSDLGEILSKKFFRKFTILEIITNLVSQKSIHSQFNENPKEILSLIHKILEKSKEGDEKILLMLFSIYREFIYKLKDVNQQKEYLKEVEKLKGNLKSAELKDQIDQIFNLESESKFKVDSEAEYKDAINLLSENETHCKVYGINLLIKLLAKRDPQTVANKHSVLAIALKNLKDQESYSFLNVIRLLVVLTSFLESEVIDALIHEYKNKDLEIDERLKIGEVIIKVTELLGEISYKYKDVLINCFLMGSRDTNDEFRTSSLVNLGAVCKILSYQIHNFFHEVSFKFLIV